MNANAYAEVRYEGVVLERGARIGTVLAGAAETVQRANIHCESDSCLHATTSRWQERYQGDVRVGSTLVAASPLSSRERSILERIGQGKSNKEIAKDLCIAPETVKSHVKNIFIKLAVKKRAQAVARTQGLGTG